MFKKYKQNEISFHGVGLAFIFFGAVTIGLGVAYWYLNFFGGYHFPWPSIKVFAGAIIALLGYIVLELELFRTK